MSETFDFDNIQSAANPEVYSNNNFQAINHMFVYGKRQSTTSGLVWGYRGGRWGGFAIAAGTLTLANASDNYIVVNRTTGAISVETTDSSPPAPINWLDTDNYARVYKITTVGGVVSAVEDHRAGEFGVHGAGASGAGGTAGRHEVPISAASMTPSVSGGCAALAKVATAANRPDVVSLDFDQTTQEYAQFSVFMPKSWNEGTLTFIPKWSHASGGATFGVVWDLQAVAVSDDDSINAAYGTAVTSTDTGGTADDLYTGPESAAMTVAGTPAANDTVFFRISRVTGNGGDTLDLDARLHGIVLIITTDAENDA